MWPALVYICRAVESVSVLVYAELLKVSLSTFSSSSRCILLTPTAGAAEASRPAKESCQKEGSHPKHKINRNDYVLALFHCEYH